MSAISVAKSSLSSLSCIRLTKPASQISRNCRSYSEKPFLNQDFTPMTKESLDDSLDMGPPPSGDIVATVFGSTGQIGRSVVSYLTKTGAQVITPFRGEERYHSHLRISGEVGQVVPIRWTVRDKEAIKIAVEQSKIVINLTGRTHETSNFNFYQANTEPAVNIAQACKEAGVERLIQISAVGVGSGSASKFLKSREEAERAVLDIFPDATIARITVPFGRLDRFFNKYGLLVNRLPFFLLMNDPERRIQPVYALDVAQAMSVMAFQPKTKGKIFEFGGPDVINWEQFADFILKQTKYDGMKPIVKVDPKSYFARAAASVMAYSRSRFYTPDELSYYANDIVANPAALSFADLNIKPHTLQEATPIFGMYKSKLRA